MLHLAGFRRAAAVYAPQLAAYAPEPTAAVAAPCHVAHRDVVPGGTPLARAATDHPSVDMYNMLNPFDAISSATPASGMPAQLSWPIPPTLAPGNYVLFVEGAREFDMNMTYNANTFPSPTTDSTGHQLL